MAYILKSNQVVNNPAREFTYLTDYGVAEKDLASYFNRTKSNGYTLSQSQFTAISNLIINLKTLGVWDNILEFLPLLGNTISSQMTKIKGLHSNQATVFNSIDNSFVDGVLGLKWATQVTTNAKAINLGLSNMDIYNGNGYGVISYFRNTAASTVNDYRTLFGADSTLNTPTSSNQQIVLTINNSNKAVSNQMHQAVIPTTTVPADKGLIITSFKWNQAKLISERFSFIDGVQQSSTISTVQLSVPTHTTDITLGAKHVNGSATNGGYSWAGEIRLFILTDGNIPQSKVTALNTVINDFLNATGKII